MAEDAAAAAAPMDDALACVRLLTAKKGADPER
jgi:hypothetical protein